MSWLGILNEKHKDCCWRMCTKHVLENVIVFSQKSFILMSWWCSGKQKKTLSLQVKHIWNAISMKPTTSTPQLQHRLRMQKWRFFKLLYIALKTNKWNGETITITKKPMIITGVFSCIFLRGFAPTYFRNLQFVCDEKQKAIFQMFKQQQHINKKNIPKNTRTWAWATACSFGWGGPNFPLKNVTHHRWVMPPWLWPMIGHQKC